MKLRRRTTLAVLAAAAMAASVLPATAGATAPATPPGGSRSPADRPPAAAQAWAQGSQASALRRCRSGNALPLDVGNRSGAYQLTGKQWAGHGGRRFAARASGATRAEQNLVAWRLWRRTGWKQLQCLTKDWMRTTYSQAPGTKVDDILIPGTHDAGSGLIDVTAPCAPKLIVGAPSVYETAIQINPCGTAALARAQEQNLGPQLRGGVRYLDLRIGIPKDQVITSLPAPKITDPADVPLVLHHEVVSQPLSRGLGQVITFANNHPKEQMVLDFQHVTFTGNTAIDAYYTEALTRMLTDWAPQEDQRTVCSSSWSRTAFPAADAGLMNKVSIGRAWRAKRNLIVVFPKGVMPDRPCFRTREQLMMSLWPNTQDPTYSTSYNHRELKQRRKILRTQPKSCLDSQGNWCGLFVNQLQLSFQTDAQVECILKSPPGCSLLALSQKTNNQRAGQMTDWVKRQRLPVNIAMIDFYNLSKPSLVDRLLSLNWHSVWHRK